MQRHGGGQCGSVVGRGVREARDGVLLPSQVHVIVYPLQRLWGKQLGWEGHPKLQAPDTSKERGTLGIPPIPPAQTHGGCRRMRSRSGLHWAMGCIVSPTRTPTLTHHAWVLGLERYKLPQRGHVGWLVGGHWRRWRVQDVMVAGNDGGERLVGDGKLLHGACLDQLQGRQRRMGVRPPPWAWLNPCTLPRASSRPCASRSSRSGGLGYSRDLQAPTARVVPRRPPWRLTGGGRQQSG